MESSVALKWLTESVDLLVFQDSAPLWGKFNVDKSGTAAGRGETYVALILSFPPFKDERVERV